MTEKGQSIRTTLWSVRMRASKGEEDASSTHISGAEGIYETSEMAEAVGKYVQRAMTHPRGRPDGIHVAVERIRLRPKRISALPVMTLGSATPEEADRLASRLLRTVGVSVNAIRGALKILRGGTAMRGASLISAESGKRLEPDIKRGIRASKMGVAKDALPSLQEKLDTRGIDTDRVMEALMLASKVASAKGVLAELCISDDPDYTTGYVASKSFGYIRLPNIKKPGDPCGGRAFFLEKGADTEAIIEYLEKTPVVVAGGRRRP